MPDPKVEIVGIRELRLGEVLTMSYPGFPVLGTKQVVPMFLETMDPKTGEKVELKLPSPWNSWPNCRPDPQSFYRDRIYWETPILRSTEGRRFGFVKLTFISP